jgi:high mobility group protein B2
MPVAEIMKEVSVRWSKMLKENKKPYEELAQRDKKRYERELYEVK